MKISRRWIAALALTLLAAGSGAAIGGNAWHANGPRAGISAGGSWYSVADGRAPAA